MSGVLYVVATPIGNLEDMTYRAVRILAEVDLIAAEDTRHSRTLLEHYGIRTAQISYHEHNEEGRAEQLLEHLRQDKSIALISDAGTPCIADPGYRLVSRCRAAGVTVVPVPGASALVSALSVSGLPTDAFRFVGFAPAKEHGRRQLFERLKNESATVVFYESPHRLLKSLQDLGEVCGQERPLAIARELTKRYEEIFCGTISQALQHFGAQAVRGELVVLLAPGGGEQPQLSVVEALQQMRDETDLSWKEIVKQVARQFDMAGSDVYRESLALRNERD